MQVDKRITTVLHAFVCTLSLALEIDNKDSVQEPGHYFDAELRLGRKY